MMIVVLLCVIGISGLELLQSDSKSINTEQAFFSKTRRKVMIWIASVTIVFYLLNYSVGLRLILYIEVIILMSAVLKMLFRKA